MAPGLGPSTTRLSLGSIASEALFVRTTTAPGASPPVVTHKEVGGVAGGTSVPPSTVTSLDMGVALVLPVAGGSSVGVPLCSGRRVALFVPPVLPSIVHTPLGGGSEKHPPTTEVVPLRVAPTPPLNSSPTKMEGPSPLKDLVVNVLVENGEARCRTYVVRIVADDTECLASVALKRSLETESRVGEKSTSEA